MAISEHNFSLICTIRCTLIFFSALYLRYPIDSPLRRRRRNLRKYGFMIDKINEFLKSDEHHTNKNLKIFYRNIYRLEKLNNILYIPNGKYSQKARMAKRKCALCVIKLMYQYYPLN